ncbi:hypothetical protein HK405_005174 [Cladochytrium tenue]|nr:hypothetical protein HK405_005174 [Cladochytrium tenue]
MKTNVTLRDFDVYEIDFDDEMQEAMAAVSENRMREIIKSIDDEGVQNVELNVIDSVKCANSVLEHIQTHSVSLQSINLMSIFRGYDSLIATLCSIISSNSTPSLRSLHLYDIRGSGDEFLSAIAKALESNTHLRVFTLLYVEFGDAASDALASMIRSNKTLSALRLEGRYAGLCPSDAALERVADAVADSATLELLAFDGGARPLVSIMTRCRPLRRLQVLPSASFTAAGLQAVAAAAGASPTLVELACDIFVHGDAAATAFVATATAAAATAAAAVAAGDAGQGPRKTLIVPRPSGWRSDGQLDPPSSADGGDEDG